MTPKQRERIRQAAIDLARELNEAKADFEVFVHKIDQTCFEHHDVQYHYSIEVVCTTKGQITIG